MADCQQVADPFSMITPAASITISTTMPTRKSRYMTSVMGIGCGPWPPVPLGWFTCLLLDDERFRPYGSQSWRVAVCGRCRVIWLTAHRILGILGQRCAAIRFLIPEQAYLSFSDSV